MPKLTAILPVAEPSRSLFWGQSYVGSLYAILREELHAEVDLGPGHFWRPREGVDVILMQWPEALFDWRPIDADDVEEFWDVLEAWHQLGTKVILFRHNLRPHLINSPHYEAVYMGLMERTDAVVHLGQYSRDECPKFKGVLHRVIAHPRYVQDLPDIRDARSRLGLDIDRPTLLIYGATRHVKELRMIRRAARLFSRNFGGQVLFGTFPVHLLPVKRGGQFLMPLIERWWKWRFNAKVHSGMLHGLVEDDYLAATDFILVPRLEDHLNSGVLVKALSLGITPIATSVGNLSEIGHRLDVPMLDDNSALGLSYLFQHVLSQESKQRVEWKSHSADAWGREAIAEPLRALLEEVGRPEWPAGQGVRKAQGWGDMAAPKPSKRERGVVRRLPRRSH